MTRQSSWRMYEGLLDVSQFLAAFNKAPKCAEEITSHANPHRSRLRRNLCLSFMPRNYFPRVRALGLGTAAAAGKRERLCVCKSTFCCRMPVSRNSALTTGKDKLRALSHSALSSSHDTTTTTVWACHRQREVSGSMSHGKQSRNWDRPSEA